MDEYFVKWDEFGGNLMEYAKMLRKTQRLFDVTFVTEDGVHIQAHKIILSSASDYLRDIIKENNASSIIIYLREIESVELEKVLGFIYSGESFIAQEEVKKFVETCKVLQLKGLKTEFTVTSCENRSQSIVKRLYEQEDLYSKTDRENIKKEKSVKAIKSLDDIINGQLIEVKAENPQVNADHELDIEIQEMIEKHERQWKCKVCGKTAANKQDIKNHAETHIKGMVHACHLCAKSFSNRKNLRNHVYNIHSELFACESCGKYGMTRNAFRLHNRNQHF